MKQAIIVTGIVVALAALFGYYTYMFEQRPKPAATTVSISKYNTLADELKTHDAVNLHNLALKQTELDRVTNQRNQLCSQYQRFKPAPTAAQCQ